MFDRSLRPSLVGVRPASDVYIPDREYTIGARTGALRLAIAAITLHFLASSNVLYTLGINYDVPGGNPLIKFHPASYLVALAALSALRRGGTVRAGLARSFQEAPAYLVFIAAMLLCSIFASVSIGTRGAAVFIENYVSAGLLAYALEASTLRARRNIGRLMLGFCLVNVAVAVGETLTHTHVVTPFIGAGALVEGEGDFRGTAGFSHPLTGAAVTMMCMLCLPELGLPSIVVAICLPVLGVGLLAFGGRTALIVSIVALSSGTAYLIVRDLVLRRLNGKLLASSMLAFLLFPPAAYVLLNYTPIGERLVAHFYVDESADVRRVQWRVLDHISSRDAMFGIPEDEIPSLIFTVNLDERLGEIENPWLLTFLKIGALGCLIYLAGVIPFLLRLYRMSSLWGKILLASGLIVVSSSNSIGVKSDILFFLTAFIVTAGGYGARAALPSQAANTAYLPSPIVAHPSGRLRRAVAEHRSSVPPTEP